MSHKRALIGLSTAVAMTVLAMGGAFAQTDPLRDLSRKVGGVLDISTEPRLLIVESAHGVSNTRILGVGDEYAEGWAFAGASDESVTMRKGEEQREVRLASIAPAAASANTTPGAGGEGRFPGAAAFGRGGLAGRGLFSNSDAEAARRGEGRGRGGRGGAVSPEEIQAAMASGDIGQLMALGDRIGNDPEAMAEALQGLMNAQGNDPQALIDMMQNFGGGRGGPALLFGAPGGPGRGGRGGFTVNIAPPAQ